MRPTRPSTRNAERGAVFATAALLLCTMLASPSAAIEQHEATTDESWTRIAVNGVYAEPVVIAGPPSFDGSDAGVVRLKDVTPSDFAIRFQEWDYLDHNHTDERISYLVGESGRQTQADGDFWEFGTFKLDGVNEWSTQRFESAFPGKPKLFLTVQSYVGSDPIVVRARNVDDSKFEAAFVEGERNPDGDHFQETVGYLAIYSDDNDGAATIGGVSAEYALDTLLVDEDWTAVEGFNLRLQEERGGDNETGHANESVDVLTIGGGIFAQDVSANGSDPASLRRTRQATPVGLRIGTITFDESWRNLSAPGPYDEPVVITGPPSYNGPDPGVIRLRNVDGGDSADFDLRFQEWNYRDGNHTEEGASYLVIEAGRHEMPDGAVWEAGTFETEGVARFKRRQFLADFPSTPKLFLSVQTFNGSDTIAVRARNVTADGFDAALFEQESLDNSHFREVVGYLAVYDPDDQGALSAGGAPTAYRTQTVTLDDAWTDVDGLKLKVEEERSADDEVRHDPEDVDVLTFHRAGRTQGLFAQDVSTNGPNPAALRFHPTGVRRGTVRAVIERVENTGRGDACFTDRDFSARMYIENRSKSFSAGRNQDQIRQDWAFVRNVDDWVGTTVRVKVRDRDNPACGGGDDHMDLHPDGDKRDIRAVLTGRGVGPTSAADCVVSIPGVDQSPALPACGETITVGGHANKRAEIDFRVSVDPTGCRTPLTGTYEGRVAGSDFDGEPNLANIRGGASIAVTLDQTCVGANGRAELGDGLEVTSPLGPPGDIAGETMAVDNARISDPRQVAWTSNLNADGNVFLATFEGELSDGGDQLMTSVRIQGEARGRTVDKKATFDLRRQ